MAREGGAYEIDPVTGESRLVERTGPDPRRADAPPTPDTEAADTEAAEARQAETGTPMPVDDKGRAVRGGSAKKPPLGAAPTTPAEEA